MNKERYQDLSLSYFRGKLPVKELISHLDQIIPINVEKVSLPQEERVMLITNHPAADPALSLPAELIAGLKGGNTRNFPSHWFPIVRQMMLYKSLGRRFFTIAYDIGWPEAMQELWHLLIRSHGNGRCQEIISRMQGDDSSLVIFPEGGAKNLEIFRTGFFHIALELGIRHLVVGAFSPMLSLDKENVFKIIHTQDMGQYIDPVIHFVEAQKEIIRKNIPHK